MSADKKYLETPDGRYFVVRGRLWRCSDPRLSEADRALLVHELMTARRTLRRSAQSTDVERAAAHATVDTVKRKLGERGPVWWDDGAPDYNRSLIESTPYAQWFHEAHQG